MKEAFMPRDYSARDYEGRPENEFDAQRIALEKIQLLLGRARENGIDMGVLEVKQHPDTHNWFGLYRGELLSDWERNHVYPRDSGNPAYLRIPDRYFTQDKLGVWVIDPRAERDLITEFNRYLST
jgi:hypothetical protein